jgi:hypothetical protein
VAAMAKQTRTKARKDSSNLLQHPVMMPPLRVTRR